MFHKTLALGGTISGEHAVGMIKNQWNNAELGPDVDYLQHQIKALFDPMNILNQNARSIELQTPKRRLFRETAGAFFVRDICHVQVMTVLTTGPAGFLIF